MTRKGESRPDTCQLLTSFALWEKEVGFPEVSRDIIDEIDQCRLSGQCRAPEICHARDEGQRLGATVIEGTSFARRGSVLRDIGESATVAPFHPQARVATAEDAMGNRVDRLPLSTETLKIKRDRLADLYFYWEALQNSGGGRLSDVDPVRLIQLGLLDRMHLINADDPDPAGLVVEVRAPGAPAVPGSLRNGDKLARHPVQILADSTIDDYDRVRRHGQPQYARVESSLLDRRYRYRRLVLPLSTSGDRVDRLLVVIDAD
jgi:hypothetical protein